MRIDTPFEALLPKLVAGPSDRPTEAAEAQTWDAAQSQARLLQSLIGLAEFYEVEVPSTGIIIVHALQRMPTGWLQLGIDEPRIVYTDYGKWTNQRFYLRSSAGTPRVRFALF